MILKCVEIGGIWDSARTASTGVEQTRLMMALTTSICALSSLLLVVVIVVEQATALMA